MPARSTKLAPPTLPATLVARSQLLTALRSTPGGGTAIVSGAPGSGKSVLLTHFALLSDTPTAWLALDRADNDPTRFWDYVRRAIVGVVGDAPPGNPNDATTSGVSPADEILALLADAEARGRHFDLVLDDLHVVTEPAIREELEVLLWRLPATARVFIGTRTDPPFGLSRLRVAGRLVEIRERDRRFDRAALDALLEAHGVELDDAVRAALLERTEGWVAGIQLALASMRDHPDPAAFVASLTGTERTLAEYLLDEGLDRQAPETRRFLLETSILEVLSGPLCDAVTGGTSSATILRALEREHVFVSEIDAPRDAVAGEWYRYHALFAGLLRSELELTDASELRRLRRRAGRWFEAAGLVSAAMEQFLAGAWWEDAERVLVANESDYFNRSRRATLRDWYLALPPDDQTRGTRLLRLFWSSAMPALVPEAAAALADVRRHAADHPDDTRFAAEAAVAAAFLALLEGHEPRMRELAAAALVQARVAGLGPCEAPVLMAQKLAARAEIWAGAPDAAQTRLEQLVATGDIADPYLRATTLATLAYAAVESGGDDSMTVRLASSAIDGLGEVTDPAPVGTEAWFARGIALARLGRLDEATADLAAARAIAKRHPGERWCGDLAAVELARVAMQRGDITAAQQLLDSVDRVDPVDRTAPMLPVVSTSVGVARAELHAMRAARLGIVELTARETEVLELLRTRLSLHDIAAQLFISSNTLKSHLRGIYQKLGASGRDDAVRIAMEANLLAS